jgi:hypothetical protein
VPRSLSRSEGGFHPYDVGLLSPTADSTRQERRGNTGSVSCLTKRGFDPETIQTMPGFDPCFECGRRFECLVVCVRDSAFGVGRPWARAGKIRVAGFLGVVLGTLRGEQTRLQERG